MSISRRNLSLLAAALAALALAVLVSACGGGGDSTAESTTGAPTTTASGGGEAPGLAAVSRIVEEHTEPPSSIGPTAPIGKPIPKGKSVVYVNCGAEACTADGESLKEATELFGWSFEEIAAEPTPQAIQAAFTEAVRLNPDAVVSGGFSTTLYERQLKELKKMGAAVLSNLGPEEAGDGLDLQLIDPKRAGEGTALLADKMIVDAEGKGEIGLIAITGFPIVELYTASFEQELKAKCPECSLKTLEISPASLGKEAGTEIVNFLRANPGIESIFLSYGGLAVGLESAIQTGGIDAPRIYTFAPDVPEVEALRSGEETAAVPASTSEIGWYWADALARIFTGGDATEDENWTRWTIWSAEDENIPDATGGAGTPPVVADFQQQFKALWGM